MSITLAVLLAWITFNLGIAWGCWWATRTPRDEPEEDTDELRRFRDRIPHRR